MTTAERNHAHIEKKQFNVVFAFEIFHSYIKGYEILVETYHKPLDEISKKHFCDAPPKLQLSQLCINKYELALDYTPGKDVVIADTLSRAFSPKEVTSTTESEVHIHMCIIRYDLLVSERKWAEIVEATSHYVEVQRVICRMTDKNVTCPKPYVSFIYELSIVEGVILKAQIPNSIKSHMLKLIHEEHMDIEKCKRRARHVICWQNKNIYIYETVSRVQVCAT